MSKLKNDDIEALLPAKARSSSPLPPTSATTISSNDKFAYLAVYFLCNVSLTIYNKAVLGKFAYPWLLTTLHAASASIGCYILLLRGSFTLTKLSYQENAVLVLFSFLFTFNIAISNVSLSMVSIPFHQILRSTTPIFTIIIYRVRYNRTYATRTYMSLIPIVIGVGFATYGDYYFTPAGFFLTLLGVVLASIKTVVSNRIMTGPLALSALEVLFRMSPLAVIQGLIYSAFSGELSRLRGSIALVPLESTTYSSSIVELILSSKHMLLALAGNGILAFLLNIASFNANKNTGALTMTVCGNVKQCMTVLLGIIGFGVKVGFLNGLGMMITLLGAAWYSVLELQGKKGK